MKQDSAPSFEFGCIFNFCICLYIISHLRDTLHPPRIEVQPKSKIQYAGFDLSRRSRSTENAETCIVSAELSWRVKRVEGPYGAASGEADRSTLLPLRERNLRAATTPLPGGSSCAHASEHTHTHTHTTQPMQIKSSTHTCIPPIRRDGLYGAMERYPDRTLDDQTATSNLGESPALSTAWVLGLR